PLPKLFRIIRQCCGEAHQKAGGARSREDHETATIGGFRDRNLAARRPCSELHPGRDGKVQAQAKVGLVLLRIHRSSREMRRLLHNTRPHSSDDLPGAVADITAIRESREPSQQKPPATLRPSTKTSQEASRCHSSSRSL